METTEIQLQHLQWLGEQLADMADAVAREAARNCARGQNERRIKKQAENLSDGIRTGLPLKI